MKTRRNHHGWWIVALALASPTGTHAQSAEETREMKSTILVHITHGPEHPTRAALGFAVAAAAAARGHAVTVFLAGDGVQLARKGVVEHLAGLGTGNLGESFRTLVDAEAHFFLSGGSSQARGLSPEQIALPDFEMASPARLVELAVQHDRMFVY